MMLLVKPAFIAVVVAITWLKLRTVGLFVDFLSNKTDEGMMASGTIAFLFIVYGLMSAFVMNKVWTEWRDMEDAVRNEDEKKFVDLKDRRVPKTLKMLLIVFSLFITAAFFLAGFQNVVRGFFSMFAVVFMLMTVWEVLMDLDDYFTGEWNIDIKALPKEWQTKYFQG